MSRELDARVFKIVGGFDLFEGDIPYFSSDMNAAMEVMKNLNSNSRNEEDRFFCRVGTPIKGGWWSEFERVVYAGEPDIFIEVDDTAATAICLAALRAKGDGDWVDNYLKKENK